jgi:hypothetical protein
MAARFGDYLNPTLDAVAQQPVALKIRKALPGDRGLDSIDRCEYFLQNGTNLGWH